MTTDKRNQDRTGEIPLRSVPSSCLKVGRVLATKADHRNFILRQLFTGFYLAFVSLFKPLVELLITNLLSFVNCFYLNLSKLHSVTF